MRRNFQESLPDSDFYGGEQDADPRVGLVNLADVMLVFACGLMIALVSHWNLNLADVERVNQADMEAVDDVSQMVDDMKSGGSNYIEQGKVYQDPETGQLYLLNDSSE